MSSLHFGSQHFHKLNIFTVVCVTAIIFRQFLPTQSVICNRVYWKSSFGETSVSFGLPCRQDPTKAALSLCISDRSCLTSVLASVVKWPSHTHTAAWVGSTIDTGTCSAQHSYFTACIHCRISSAAVGWHLGRWQCFVHAAPIIHGKLWFHK